MTPARSSVVLRMGDKIGCVMKSTYSSNVPENVAAGVAMGTVIVLLFCGYSLGISYDAKLILEKGYTCTGAQVMNASALQGVPAPLAEPSCPCSQGTTMTIAAIVAPTLCEAVEVN
uniref:Uncharacterized protein n=1 Tax=Oryza meridionalis TaxID=40149 RepID=A0A0E0C2C0_9ORYZ